MSDTLQTYFDPVPLTYIHAAVCLPNAGAIFTSTNSCFCCCFLLLFFFQVKKCLVSVNSTDPTFSGPTLIFFETSEIFFLLFSGYFK